MTIHRRQDHKIFDPSLMNTALRQSFVKLNPGSMIKNPVMFTVEIGTFVMLLVILYSLLTGDRSHGGLGYNTAIFIVLFLTVLFANFAEAIAEARGKAQAESLRKTRQDTPAKLLAPVDGTLDEQIKIISSSQLRLDDHFVCETGEIGRAHV